MEETMLEYVIEGLLMQNDMSGYDMKQNIDSVKYFNASYGSIYPTLKKMETEGLITSKEIVEGGKYKKIYSINDEGREKFLEWLQKPIDIIRSDNEHLVKMSFYKYLPKEKLKDLIPELIINVSAMIRRLEVFKAKLEKDMDEFQIWTVIFGIDYYRFLKKWYQRFLEELN